MALIFWSDGTDDGNKAHTLYCVVERESETSGPCKVGITAHLATRLTSLQCGNSRELVMPWKVSLADRVEARAVEQFCLAAYRPTVFSAGKRLKSEWLTASPADLLEKAIGYLNADKVSVWRVF